MIESLELTLELFVYSQSYLRKRKIKEKYLEHLIWPNGGCEHYRTLYLKNRKIHIKSRHAASYPPYMHFNLNKSILYTKQDECIDMEGGRDANTFLCPLKFPSELNGVM